MTWHAESARRLASHYILRNPTPDPHRNTSSSRKGYYHSNRNANRSSRFSSPSSEIPAADQCRRDGNGAPAQHYSVRHLRYLRSIRRNCCRVLQCTDCCRKTAAGHSGSGQSHFRTGSPLRRADYDSGRFHCIEMAIHPGENMLY